MNILVIDDDQSLRKSLRLALETMHHKVVEACDSAQAQELLGHGLFEVAFLDLRLGREKGLDLLPALLRLALKQVKALALAGRDFCETRNPSAFSGV